jgi:hypothetical protein
MQIEESTLGTEDKPTPAGSLQLPEQFSQIRVNVNVPFLIPLGYELIATHGALAHVNVWFSSVEDNVLRPQSCQFHLPKSGTLECLESDPLLESIARCKELIKFLGRIGNDTSSLRYLGGILHSNRHKLVAVPLGEDDSTRLQELIDAEELVATRLW